ncbi:helix-turn-helix domain-containing protein (plasmid) [Bacillus thuringiensis]|uniref:helix-turn-helix domain-containing protein n=1 Tax=Bacillus thuringiensis TaxID=1428 RepID=UPI003D729F13
MTNYMNQYDNLSLFETTEEMDFALEIAKKHYANDLNKTQIAVLDFIAQHALKAVGVAYLKVPTIAEGVGKSLRTINYATKKLVDLGLVDKYETIRKKSGGSGANIYVIACRIAEGIAERFADCEIIVKPTESKVDEPIPEKESLSQSLPKTLNKSLKEFEKNNKPKIVKDIELENEPLFADTPEVLRHAYALIDSSLGNKLTKRLVSAYKNSGLASSSAWKLQDRCIHDSTFARELGDRITQSIRNKKNGNEDELCAYVYKTALNMFNDYQTHEQIARIDVGRELDWFSNPITQKLVNARIEGARHVNLHELEFGKSIFNNDDLPW